MEKAGAVKCPEETRQTEIPLGGPCLWRYFLRISPVLEEKFSELLRMALRYSCSSTKLNRNAMDNCGDCRCQLAVCWRRLLTHIVDGQLQTGVVTKELVCGLVKDLIAVTGELCR